MGKELSLALQMKLASVIVHAKEMLSPDGKNADRYALMTFLDDPEIVAFAKEMISSALAPLPRKDLW